MKNVNSRLIEVFNSSNLKQNEFANRIGVSQAYISKLFKEESDKTPSDRILKLVCSEFNVDENWLRTGNGNMFVEAKEISLDDYARKNGISEYETDIMKLYMSLDKNTRNQFMDGLRELSRKHEAKKNLSVVKDSTEDFGKPVAAHTTAPQTDEELRLMKKDLDELK